MIGQNLFKTAGTIAAAVFMSAGLAYSPAQASSGKLGAEAVSALSELKEMKPGVDRLAEEAVAVLVIPEITKAGLVVGGAHGKGALLIKGDVDSYWSYTAASIGYQLGVQQTRQAMFFMTDDALKRFKSGEGFEFGADLEATIIDDGAEVAVDTTQDRNPVIVFVYGREGLLAGASVQGGKYERVGS